MSETVLSLIAKPLTVAERTVTSVDVGRVIDRLADTPEHFTGMALTSALPDHGGWWRQEVMNRLLQRWRKLGLISFKAGRWSLAKGAWDTMQAGQRVARDKPAKDPTQ